VRLIGLIFFIEVRRPFTFFGENAKFEPVIVFVAELKKFYLFGATIRATFGKLNDIAGSASVLGLGCLVLKFG